MHYEGLDGFRRRGVPVVLCGHHKVAVLVAYTSVDSRLPQAPRHVASGCEGLRFVLGNLTFPIHDFLSSPADGERVVVLIDMWPTYVDHAMAFARSLRALDPNIAIIMFGSAVNVADLARAHTRGEITAFAICTPDEQGRALVIRVCGEIATFWRQRAAAAASVGGG